MGTEEMRFLPPPLADDVGTWQDRKSRHFAGFIDQKGIGVPNTFTH